MKHLFIIPFLTAFANVPGFPNIFHICSFVVCTIVGIWMLWTDRKFEKDRADLWHKAYLEMRETALKSIDKPFPGEEWRKICGYNDDN